ncbi:core-2/I-Branching enzyme domain-containing protein [Ditylenchus destructor]|uniref:Core-2/I-Branching enzyme domain-containing protein n=1 Tax=Ditylenchus destructor TaxID=166010 RepID=A0AAD4QUR9_9BILA|nr:core-2/I-Branching enzyme domain-containing protein [Ditylenchus destructor]
MSDVTGASREQDMRINNMLTQREILDATINNTLHGFRQKVPSCAQLAEDVLNESRLEKVREARNWNFDEVLYRQQYLFSTTVKDKCKAIKERFVFLSTPLSQEEETFPLAYGMLVYRSSIQVYFLLSAVYQPQNAYCIAVDSKSTLEFKRDMELLSDCFPNIFITQVENVEWCGFSVARGVFNCLKYLKHLNHQWRYYQYLSGVDLPLKTNLEMVRIFKRLKGTVNVDVAFFPPDRIRPETKDTPPPLPLWKSSLSALLPRETVDMMIKHEKVWELFNFLKGTNCADESLWTTVIGNKNLFPIPNAFNANEVYAKIEKDWKQRSLVHKYVNSTKLFVGTPEEPFSVQDYYISRYQIWEPFLRGKYVSQSCVYGVGDINNLLARPELVAHKFYMDFEPAAYFCVYEAVRQRALNDMLQQRFQGALYSKLPQVRMLEGEPVDQLQFFWTD